MKHVRSFIEVVAILVVMAVTACEKSEPIINTSGAKPYSKSNDITNLECGAYKTVTTSLGNLQNNVWNSHSANGFAWQQCLATRDVKKTKQYGWYWSWPESGTEVYAQPQVTLGQTPWVGHSHPNPGYPIPLANLEKLLFDYDIEINATGKLNLVATLWMTTSPVILKRVDKDSIAVEFKIWTYATKGFHDNPSGEKFGEMTSSGMTWEVWIDKECKDTSGINDNHWVFIAFRAKKQQLTLEYDAAEMIAYARENNLFDKDLYIADIQLGNEIMSGNGETWLKRFSVTVERQVDEVNSDVVGTSPP